MNNKDVDIYLKRYNERLDKFGYAPESLGWGGGKARQYLRFKTLLEIGIKNEDSILDVGCGFADMFEFLNTTGWNGQYTGIDINSTLLEVAKNVHQQVDVRTINILNTDLDLKYDWVVSSGIFNAKLSFEDNLVYTRKMLRKMYDICNQGVAVDFMSTYVDYQHPDAYHMSPIDLIDFAKNELKTKLILRMDYLPYEYCIYLKK